MYASHHNHLEAFKLLLSRGADPTWRNNRGANVLQLMAKRGQVEMAQAALRHVVKVNGDIREFLDHGNDCGQCILYVPYEVCF